VAGDDEEAGVPAGGVDLAADAGTGVGVGAGVEQGRDVDVAVGRG
jgi:hypothetical protein